VAEGQGRMRELGTVDLSERVSSFRRTTSHLRNR
jgi:hypothetical protein